MQMLEQHRSWKDMYISNVYIKNIRCFKEIDVSFEQGDKISKWNTILGDNSSGKTCFLRCIAIGLCDEVSGAALMKELYGSFIRDGENEAKIKITLLNPNPRTKEKLIIETIIKRQQGYETITQEVKKGRHLRDKVFICGYGIQRSIEGDTSFNEYSILEAVYTLFNYSSPLQNPEVILNRQNKRLQGSILKLIENILMLEIFGKSKKISSLETTDKGIVIKAPGGDIFLEDFGDGYRTTFTWLLDFIGWQIYDNRLYKVNRIEDIRGIVLLDEVELHLHPRLQRNIVYKLRDAFPNVQFITTTHSPLIVSNIGKLSVTGESQIIHFSFLPNENKVEKYIFSENEAISFKGLQYDQLLASKPFDYQIRADEELEKFLIAASQLAGKGKKRTSKENKKYRAVKEYLIKAMQPSGYTEFERDIQKELHDKMRENIKALERKLLNDKN